VDEFGAAFRRVAKFSGGQRLDAPAAPVARFQERHRLAGAPKLAGSHQARSARADDHEMVVTRRSHR
jgi:hypothetical protein